VDEVTLDLFDKVNTALKGLAAAVEQIERRLCLVEKCQDLKLVDQYMAELGFKAYER
jgi:hypothetical protein